ncbi:bifunctional metallophosphatase/5'-nucleotidase [Entomospira culicis]|uniref:Bifunctional metallophosphatase/5'-nucleotidase n=1 Tax=Entomospira culicis TaxID=2719989 RepID=A0A968GGY9_9SPIO|nr:bifunctional UDP-sugar hydrolase/5'-nucleotidase [Entomospira culicis]NIZ19684.1 bifunctional metallophosphatase/5'-nucleotidase [Entomospira culicis]NIZ69898.1 bifunctional metallophosphatase/5'-nucleotidase [Entomospira culicis]WDI37003.1 bifunctional UDP-sugar hydrolase/5'-nucleotidase [Entomospira culicis]WDI38632.1 bifunctional UDP-sugar hydrolase/5'-nucleotidase [Entomospira culicis]
MMKKWFIPLLIVALFGACQKEKPSLVLEVISTTDVHGYALSPNEETIGYATIANYTEMVREAHPHVLLLDAGDYLQGSALTNLTEGADVIQVMNAMHYDAVTVGNHEFDFGWENLLQRQSEATFPLITANVQQVGVGSPFASHQTIEKGGVKIAIVGLTTPETSWKTSAQNVEGWQFLDPITTLTPLINQLKKEHAIIIVLAHLGEEGEYRASDLAHAIPAIDLIIDGHDHTPTITLGNAENNFTPSYGKRIGNTLIVNSGGNAQYLAHTTITLEKGKVVDISAKILNASDEELNAGYTMRPNAQQVVALLEEIHQRSQVILQQVVSYSPIYLDGTREVVRMQESALGRLIADSYRYEAQTDIALMNGGGIRTSIDAGDITLQDLLSVLPFNNTVVRIDLTGAEIRTALEHGLSQYPDANGAFIHGSGFTYSYDLSAPVGSRVVDIWIAETLIDPQATYSLALLNFLATGGDGFTMLDKPIVGEFSSDADILIRYIKAYPEEAFTLIEAPRSWQTS